MWYDSFWIARDVINSCAYIYIFIYLSCAWIDASCVAWLIHVYVMAHSHVWHDSPTCVVYEYTHIHTKVLTPWPWTAASSYDSHIYITNLCFVYTRKMRRHLLVVTRSHQTRRNLNIKKIVTSERTRNCNWLSRVSCQKKNTRERARESV